MGDGAGAGVRAAGGVEVGGDQEVQHAVPHVLQPLVAPSQPVVRVAEGSKIYNLQSAPIIFRLSTWRG